MSAVRGANLVDRTVPHYRVLETLGAGGVGDVYLARDLKLGRDVALKLHPEDSGLLFEALNSKTTGEAFDEHVSDLKDRCFHRAARYGRDPRPRAVQLPRCCPESRNERDSVDIQ